MASIVVVINLGEIADEALIPKYEIFELGDKSNNVVSVLIEEGYNVLELKDVTAAVCILETPA